MFEFELDIPLLNEEGIEINEDKLWKSFMAVSELHSSSMID